MEFKTLKPIFKHLFNFVILFSLSFSAFAQVELLTGYVRAMPSSVPNSAVYLSLENDGDAVGLVAVETNIAKEAQLHSITETNGITRMRAADVFIVPSHGQLTLMETGNHIMLLGLTQTLEIDDNVDFVLLFDNGEKLSVSLPVKKYHSATAAHSHH
ncbi:copper chaperone PCu(A)C [Shewanella surugensis]|uniref:Copper chaperone PCu(A)C n=1 Tax=Shewanella surugensis TaxID=212020 RepID=A0ABT0LFD8_9GAMM|nr:copper chaperone PCu(A)C [Shewanella surugensis]MCL1126422.1 copper chaperone PCu(A)C [Shewanella surugensis]